MGDYTDPTQANLEVGAYQYTNRQDYRRNEFKASVSQYLDLGKTGHQLKAGVGYTFGEEDLNRLTNGWGQISRITATVPYYRAATTSSSPRRSARAVMVDLRPGHGDGRLPAHPEPRDPDEPGRLRPGPPGKRRLPDAGEHADRPAGGAAVFETDGDRCTFVKYGFGDQVQPASG